MLVDVKAFLLHTLSDTQAVSPLNTVEQGETTGSSPEVDDEDAKQL